MLYFPKENKAFSFTHRFFLVYLLQCFSIYYRFFIKGGVGLLLPLVSMDWLMLCPCGGGGIGHPIFLLFF